MTREEELHQGLSNAVVDMDEDRAKELAQAVVDEGFDAYDAIEKGLSAGMEEVGRLYEEEEYFIPELLLCSDAMYAGIEILKPHIKKREDAVRHTVVIGVVEGDTHDIGKNLVKIMLESAGFDVIDLGRDIPAAEFVAKAEESGAEIIALATLMTTAMPAMREVIEVLENEGKRGKFKVVIGGGPLSPAFAEKIGADVYAVNAAEAARLARELVS
jgi:corrinoid protein of di/trimethylamine methyltransferase